MTPVPPPLPDQISAADFEQTRQHEQSYGLWDEHRSLRMMQGGPFALTRLDLCGNAWREGDFCPQRAVLHNGGGYSCRIVFLLWFGRQSVNCWIAEQTGKLRRYSRGCMSKVEAIEQQIEKLSADELARFAAGMPCPTPRFGIASLRPMRRPVDLMF